jgi:hypothetical protein
LQQPFGAAVVTSANRCDGLLLDRCNLRIIVERGFGLLEQSDVARRNLAQLGVEFLRGDLGFTQNVEKLVRAVSVTPNARLIIS